MARAVPLVIVLRTMRQRLAIPRSWQPRWPGYAPGRTSPTTCSTPTSGASPPATGRPRRALRSRSMVRIGRPTGSAIARIQRASSWIRRSGRRTACPRSNQVRQDPRGAHLDWPANVAERACDPTRFRSPLPSEGCQGGMIGRVGAKAILRCPLGDADPASPSILGKAALDELTTIDEEHSLARSRDLGERCPLVDHKVRQQQPAASVQVIEVDLDHDHLFKPRQRSCAGIGFRSSGLKMASKPAAVKPTRSQWYGGVPDPRDGITAPPDARSSPRVV